MGLAQFSFQELWEVSLFELHTQMAKRTSSPSWLFEGNAENSVCYVEELSECQSIQSIPFFFCAKEGYSKIYFPPDLLLLVAWA